MMTVTTDSVLGVLFDKLPGIEKTMVDAVQNGVRVKLAKLNEALYEVHLSGFELGEKIQFFLSPTQTLVKTRCISVLDMKMGRQGNSIVSTIPSALSHAKHGYEQSAKLLVEINTYLPEQYKSTLFAPIPSEQKYRCVY